MSPPRVDLTGQRFGSLTVVCFSHSGHRYALFWAVRCDCGTTKIVAGDAMKSGGTMSCGCRRIADAILRLPLPTRFWCRVQKSDGCWLWTGKLTPHGYATLRVEARITPAHRYSWELHNGPIPDGFCVCHRCDVRNCVRPDHLFLGTDADNYADMVAKGRRYTGAQCFGESCPQARLTEDDVRAIRASALTVRELAAQYGVSPATLHAARIGKTWRRTT